MTNEFERMRAALPGYEFGDQIGSGGYGVVYAGRDRLRRDVAIKVLLERYAKDAEVRARFADEARALATLSHVHIVDVYDYVEESCVLVMERLSCRLGDERRQALTMEGAMAATLATCEALHAAHRRKILHRDVKPENVLFSSRNCPKLTDFGIAKIIGGDNARHTRTGEYLGTPEYMAPELVNPELGPLGPASDVFSTAVMIYRLLSDNFPYSSEGGALVVLHRHGFEDATPLREIASHVPGEVADVTTKGLARRPADRFSDAREFGVALARAARGAWGDDWLDRANVTIDAPELLEEATSSDPLSPPRPVPSGTVRVPSPAPLPLHDGGRLGSNQAPLGVLAPAMAAMTLLVTTLAVTFVAIRRASSDEAPRGLTVAGTAVRDEIVSLPLDRRVEVRLPTLEARSANEVQLGLSVGGVPLLPSTRTRLEQVSNNLVGASLDLSANKYLLAGTATGELRLGTDGETRHRYRFGVRPDRSPPVTVPLLVGLALLVLLIGYGRSLLRPFWPDYRVASGLVGVLFITAAGGLLGTIFIWVAGGAEPSPLRVVTCLAVLSAVCTGVALSRYRSHQAR